jgi:uncharacterized protein YbaR (Trm112 family)
MMDAELLKILCCPETHQPLHLAESALVEKLNQQIAEGNLKNRAGVTVKRKVEAACPRRRQIPLSDPAGNPRDADGRGDSADSLRQRQQPSSPRPFVAGVCLSIR